jgi:predicted dithiol-disulfide oxidoreductase (DUF899 family)
MRTGSGRRPAPRAYDARRWRRRSCRVNQSLCTRVSSWERSQLILYRFYFEAGVDGWPDAGCAGVLVLADGIPELGLLHARDI